MPNRRNETSEGNGGGEVRWVTLKVRPETKRLLDLIAAAERISLVELIDEQARERWERVKQSDLLP